MIINSLSDNVVRHYELLIEENNDPVHDPKPLRDYMDKWDGQAFIDSMKLNKSKSVLEIGVGTGRLAVRAAPLCGRFFGIDISPKTAERAKENLADFGNSVLLCGDFLTYEFNRKFDVIYSSLTFMHIKDKRKAVNKTAELLNNAGRFVLSIDKNHSEFIDTGTRKIKIYPDTAEAMAEYIKASGLNILNQYDTEFATIFVSQKTVRIG
ncbi:MAG: class I SAM-dependent methyltransferase [Firmicutes bacterium]|nr:class I SAM-dependent methyltransferase [Bacillota bacterium]